MKDQKKMIEECEKTGEPTFTLRAKDLFALNALGSYISRYTGVTGFEDNLFALELLNVKLNFESWRNKNKDKIKIPD